MQAPGRKIFPILLVSVAGIALLATLTLWGLYPPPRPRILKIIAGTRDEVYYSHAATKEEAESLGRALQAIGFFNNRGTAVLLSKGSAGTIVSFALNRGAWNNPETVLSFEEIGRRVAPSIGGFPIIVRLSDTLWNLQKAVVVGKVIVGSKDEVYYLGSATETDAEALGQALVMFGYLVNAGASVVISKDGGTVISFVVDEGVWNRPGAVADFERLVRQAAPSVGGLPVTLRLLNYKMETEKQIDGIQQDSSVDGAR